MRLNLQCHPLTPVSVVQDIAVDYEWKAHGSLWLRYHAEVLLHDLDLPDLVEAKRVDGLWENTCFELFLQESGANRYCEFNFSPSSCWAAYQFSNYRDDMRNLQLPKPPDIFLELSDSHVAMEVTLGLPDIWGAVALNAAFAAVIKENSGPKSYWALTHPPGKPDFHHKDCFTHQLKAAGTL